MSRAEMAPTVAAERIDLLDWRRRVLDLYHDIRVDPDPRSAWKAWRDVRGRLIADHAESPVDPARRRGFAPTYFDYDPELRTLAEVLPVEPEEADVPMSRDEAVRFAHVADAAFALAGEPQSLGLYWLEGYGGGVFLSFTDETSGDESYGAGRYLIDTVKGADLGSVDGRLVLDFNFAFNPSCAYDRRWACPLAPPRNRLSLAVRAGERIPQL